MKRYNALYTQPIHFNFIEQENWAVPLPDVELITEETTDQLLDDLGDPDQLEDMDEDEREEYLAELLSDNDHIFDPISNLLYPLPGLDMEPATAQAYLIGSNVVIVVVDSELFLGLSACGMNLSWDLVQAYITLGYLPPIHFSDLPNMGLSHDRRELEIIAAMKVSLEFVRDQTIAHLARLDKLSLTLLENDLGRKPNPKRESFEREIKKPGNRRKPKQKRKGQAQRSQAIMKETTQRIQALIEQGVQPWVRPWYSAGPFRNAKTGHRYSNNNAILLNIACQKNGWNDPRFLGFRQAEAVGGHVVKGQQGTPITKVHIWNAKRKENETGDGEDEESQTMRRFAWLHVFNVNQCSDLDLIRDQWTPPPSTKRNTRVDGFLEAVGVPIRDGLERAYYTPKSDYVVVPKRERFHTLNHYFATCFHELTHWTAQHLGRDLDDKNPSARAFEELVAELGSALLCAHFLVDDALTQHAATYIDGWLTLLADDPTAYHRAAVQAQKAVDFLMMRAGLHVEETEPGDIE